jgi:hypothetical protein
MEQKMLKHRHNYGRSECECGAPTPQWLQEKRREKRMLAVSRKLARADNRNIDPFLRRPNDHFCPHGWVKNACIFGCNPSLITTIEEVPF